MIVVTPSSFQDNTLNFEPVESLALNSQPLKTRLLQLKVIFPARTVYECCVIVRHGGFAA